MGVWYCTREDVELALDVKATARASNQIDVKIEAASRGIELLLHRWFFPVVATRYFDWPDRHARSRPWRLWLNEHELVSLSSIVSGGITISTSDVLLEPANYGPPYNRLEINLNSDAAFSGAATHQRSIALAGVWAGCPVNEEPAGTATAAMNSSVTSLSVSDSAAIGVGTIVKIDTERMLVTGKTMVDTTQNITGTITAQANSTTLAVADGTGFTVGEVLLLDAERMLIVDIAGNSLVVKRAWSGSVLAAHTNSDVYAARTLTVTRGALGTTAASHLDDAPILRFAVPGLVRELACAETTNLLLQSSSGYARTVGAGENERESSGRGLTGLREMVYLAHGRKGRMRAV